MLVSSMPLMPRLVAVGAMMACLAAPAARADDLFECKIKQLTENGIWLPEVVAVAHKDGAATATVNDPLIQHFEGAPIEARVESDNAKRLTLVWRLKARNSRGQNANFNFRLTIFRGNLSASMSAQPARFSNDFSAPGTCTRVKS